MGKVFIICAIAQSSFPNKIPANGFLEITHGMLKTLYLDAY